MLVTQKRKKGRRGSNGRLESWGRVITVLGFCCSRSAASAHCHTLSLDMVVEIAWGVLTMPGVGGTKTTIEPCGQKREDSVITCGLQL